MTKTILVPTDFSPCSDHALKYAMKLFEGEKVKIILLHAYSIIYYSPEIPMDFISEEITSEQENSVQQLEKRAAALKKRGIKTELVSREGMASETILKVTKEKKPDLIVMGTRGASGFKALMGSNTARIIDRSLCPVIAVPEKAKFTGLKNIAIANEYKQSDLNLIKSLLNVGPFKDTPMMLLHFAEQGYDLAKEEKKLSAFRKKIKEKFRSGKFFFSIISGIDLIDALETWVKKEKPSLIAMSAHRLSFFEKLRGKGNTRNISYHTRIPLIAFHHR